jgi:hypothetical protein
MDAYLIEVNVLIADLRRVSARPPSFYLVSAVKEHLFQKSAEECRYIVCRTASSRFNTHFLQIDTATDVLPDGLELGPIP